MHFDKSQSPDLTQTLPCIPELKEDAISFWKRVISDPINQSHISNGFLEDPFNNILLGKSAQDTIDFLDTTLKGLSDPKVWAEFIKSCTSNLPESETNDQLQLAIPGNVVFKIPRIAFQMYLENIYSYLSETYINAFNTEDPKAFDELSDTFKVIQSDLYKRLLFRTQEDKPFEPFGNTHLHTFAYYNSDNLFALSSFPNIEFTPNFLLDAVAHFNQRIEFWQEFNTVITKTNLIESHERLLTIGAKGASLETLVQIINSLKPFTDKLHLNVNVPFFVTVPTDIYLEYSNTQVLPTQLLQLYYDMTAVAKPANYLIRSSAVYSEDGELLGAGKYLTIGITANASFNDFIKAVQMVYDSVNEPEAIRYREENDVTAQELMGLVIMELKQGEHNGYVNTMRNQMPHAIDVVKFNGYFDGEYDYENEKVVDELLYNKIGSSHPFVIDRESSLIKLPLGDTYRVKLLVEADMSRGREICSPTSAHEAAFIALMIERIVRRPIQIEYVYDEHQISIVQVRPLPKRWITPNSVTFPEQRALWSSSSIGVCDQILQVIDPEASFSGPWNREEWEKFSVSEEGLLILSGSYFGGDNRSWERMLPKRGAVLLLQETGEFRGHVETCCLERGLTILQNGGYSEGGSEPLFSGLARYFDDSRFNNIFSHAQSMMRPVSYAPQEKTFFRVVSNGIQGRIYAVE